MSDNKGKAWETHFKQDFIESFPNGTIDRLYDPTGGYTGIHNISDFIAYDYPNIFYLECKSHKGTSFPFSALSQYEALLTKVGIKGVRAGVALWLIDLDKVYYLPISTVKKILDSKIKSFNPNKIDKKLYNYYEVPGEKKRVFIKCNWSFLMDTQEGE